MIGNVVGKSSLCIKFNCIIKAREEVKSVQLSTICCNDMIFFIVFYEIWYLSSVNDAGKDPESQFRLKLFGIELPE